MKTISAEQFNKMYGQEVPRVENRPGYLHRVGQSIKDTFSGLKADVGIQNEALKQAQTESNPLKATVAGARRGYRIAGAVAKAAVSPVTEALPVHEPVEARKVYKPGESPLDKFQGWAEKHPEAAKDIMNTLDIAGIIGTAESGINLSRGLKNVTTKAAEASIRAVDDLGARLPKTGGDILRATGNAPESIMTRVARLTPKEELAFKNTAGKNLGEYLVETGNFGSPDKIIAKEAEKLVSSKNMVDAEMAKLPGEYRVGPVDDALRMVIKRGEVTSSETVQSPFLQRARDLLAKSKEVGLTMEEINEAKRLLERHVKLGYNKISKPNTVEKATSIDKALREWQFRRAKELGFENLPEMNKQTQISKFIIDKLGNEVVGKQALNNISLTDWIVLAGGDPTAVGAFLTKKFFSSKSVQARIAELLNKKTPTGMIKPKSFRPAGLLEGPKQINLPGKGILEGQAKLRSS